MNDVLRLLLVAILVFHGLTHIVWFLIAWTPYRSGYEDGPWVLPGDVTLRSWIGRIFGLLALGAMALFLLAALALAAGEPWWRGAGQYGVFASLIVVVPWMRRIPRRLGVQSLVTDIVLWFVIALPLSLDILPRA